MFVGQEIGGFCRIDLYVRHEVFDSGFIELNQTPISCFFNHVHWKRYLSPKNRSARAKNNFVQTNKFSVHFEIVFVTIAVVNNKGWFSFRLKGNLWTESIKLIQKYSREIVAKQNLKSSYIVQNHNGLTKHNN